MKLMTQLFAVGALLAATHANAANIDFTSPAWSAANNQTDITIGAVTVTAGPAGAKLYQDSTDGLGVLGNKEPDEIDPQEFIEITFAMAVMLNSISVTDFFDQDGGIPSSNNDGSTPTGEVGYLSLWLDGTELGSSPLDFFGNTSDQVNGEQTITLNPFAKVDQIKFYTLGKNDDFSIKGLMYSDVPNEEIPVPEPSIAVLLGLGLMGLGLSRRRQAKKA